MVKIFNTVLLAFRVIRGWGSITLRKHIGLLGKKSSFKMSW